MVKQKKTGKTIYKKNFLKKVILRLDFDPVKLDFLSSFSAGIKAAFPLEQRLETVGGIVVDVNNNKVEKTQNIVWAFISANKLKRLEITTESILIQYSSYKDSSELLTDVEEVILKFIETAKIETINRLGLRYVNEVNLEEIKTKINWKDYIAEELIGGSVFALKTKAVISRSMGQLVLKKEGADIRFNYGIFNNDFPNEATRKEFLLDFDCVSKFPITASKIEVLKVIKEYNLYIQELFEVSVTNKFKNYLNKR